MDFFAPQFPGWKIRTGYAQLQHEHIRAAGIANVAPETRHHYLLSEGWSQDAVDSFERALNTPALSAINPPSGGVAGMAQYLIDQTLHQPSPMSREIMRGVDQFARDLILGKAQRDPAAAGPSILLLEPILQTFASGTAFEKDLLPRFVDTAIPSTGMENIGMSKLRNFASWFGDATIGAFPGETLLPDGLPLHTLSVRQLESDPDLMEKFKYWVRLGLG